MAGKKAKRKKMLNVLVLTCVISVIGMGTILFLGKTSGDKESEYLNNEATIEESETLEETLVSDWNYYEEISTLSKFEIEEYADFVISTIVNDAWDELAREIAYPITIAGEEYENEEAYLAADKSNWSSETFMKDIANEDCDEMFYNWQGIMLGERGSIWISEVVNEEYGRGEMKIIAINIE